MVSKQNIVIELKKLTKTYGKSRGVYLISLDVNKGSIFGFLGPNGAGKSTTINMLVDLIRPTNGSAKIFGLEVSKHSNAIKKNVGYLAGDFALDGDLTGDQAIKYFANLRGVSNPKYIKELINVLDANVSSKIKNLSRGNKQKIGLITALMHKPDLLIFDEPTTGLDPLIQEQFNNIILEHKKQGKTAFISSHILNEVEELCDSIAFIKEGKIIAKGVLSDILATAPLEISIKLKTTKQVNFFKNISGINNYIQKLNIISFNYNGDVNLLLKQISSLNVDTIEIKKADIEQIFMKYYKD